MKKRALRPPFLITVATLAGSMASGCGGAVTGGENAGSTGDMGQGGTHGGATSGGGGNGVTTTSGDGVTTTSGTTIGTTVTVGTGGSGTGGTGSAGGAGGTTGSNCPTSQPANGSSCASPGQVCSYPYCGSPTGTSFECVAGRWSMGLTPSCNPPPPPLPCPATEPTAGSGCSAFQYQSKTCSYPVTCCGLPWRQANYECPQATNQWRKIEPSDVGADGGGCFMPHPSCPSQLPVNGSPCCFSAPIGCNYCSSISAGYASCDGYRWRITGTACGEEGGVVLPEGGWGEGGPHYWDGGGPE